MSDHFKTKTTFMCSNDSQEISIHNPIRECMHMPVCRVVTFAQIGATFARNLQPLHTDEKRGMQLNFGLQ